MKRCSNKTSIHDAKRSNADPKWLSLREEELLSEGVIYSHFVEHDEGKSCNAPKLLGESFFRDVYLTYKDQARMPFRGRSFKQENAKCMFFGETIS